MKNQTLQSNYLKLFKKNKELRQKFNAITNYELTVIPYYDGIAFWKGQYLPMANSPIRWEELADKYKTLFLETIKKIDA